MRPMRPSNLCAMCDAASPREPRPHSHDRSDVATTGLPGRAGVIDAIFLTSNSCEQAIECVAHFRDPEMACVVVVDNASNDETAEAIRNADPDVTVLDPDGSRRGPNRGAEVGNAPFVLYLNDDVLAEPCSIRLMPQALRGRDDAVAASGRLVDPVLRRRIDTDRGGFGHRRRLWLDFSAWSACGTATRGPASTCGASSKITPPARSRRSTAHPRHTSSTRRPAPRRPASALLGVGRDRRVIIHAG